MKNEFRYFPGVRLPANARLWPKLLIISAMLAVLSCHSSRSVVERSCSFNAETERPVTLKQLPRNIVSDLNARGEIGWVFEEAKLLESATEKVYEVKIRNRDLTKQVCFTADDSSNDK